MELKIVMQGVGEKQKKCLRQIQSMEEISKVHKCIAYQSVRHFHN